MGPTRNAVCHVQEKNRFELFILWLFHLGKRQQEFKQNTHARSKRHIKLEEHLEKCFLVATFDNHYNVIR